MESNVTVTVEYQDFDDDDQTTLSKTVQFTLRNTGTEGVIVQTSLSGLPSGYSAGSIANTPVSAGGTATIAFNLNIPHQQDVGTAAIGTIIVSDTGGTELTRTTLTQKTKSMLELDQVTVDYTDEDEESQRDEFSESDTDFDLDQNVLIGTEVSVKFEINNLFDQNYGDDGTLENIELTFNSDDDDIYQEEIDDEYSFDDIEADESGMLTVTFVVDEEAETKDYDFEITIEAEDGKNALHKVERTLTLSVERQRDDVRITKAIITPTALTACDTSFMLDTTIRNLGSSRQRNVVFSIFNSKLGLDVKETMELDPFDDDDDTFSKKFVFPLHSVPAGKQVLTLKVVNNNEQLDGQPVDVNIGSCAAAPVVEEEAQEEEEETVEESAIETVPGTMQPEQTNTNTVTSSAIAETIENPFTREDMFVGLFIMAIILTLGLIIIFFIILLK